MTIAQAIERIDDLKYNTYSTHQKLQWLNQLEQMICCNILATHEGAAVPAAFDDDTPMDTPLLAQAPYEELYIHYLAAQMDYHNGEFDRYNNTMAMFQALFDSFCAAYNRKNTPKSARMRYF